MTLTLTPDTETRLRTVAAGPGQPPEQAPEVLLAQALADAETELQDTLAGLRASAADFAAGHWTTPEALDAVLQARRRGGRSDKGALPIDRSEKSSTGS